MNILVLTLLGVVGALEFASIEGGAPLQVCRLLTAMGQGMIYTAAHNLTDCGDFLSENLLVVKCDKVKSLETEFVNSKAIRPFRDFVYERVVVPSKPAQVCFSMKYFGPSLAAIRDTEPRGTIWSWSTVASFGLRIVSQLQLVHESGFAHTDLHFLNVVSTQRSVKDLFSLIESELVIIDFGDAVRIDGRDPDSLLRLVQNDLMQVMVALRYLVDGDYKFYVEKRYGFDPKKAMKRGEICTDAPRQYCDILTYIYHLRGTPDYGFIFAQLSEM